MSTQTPAADHRDLIQKLPPDATLVLRNVAWGEYEELLDAVGQAGGLRISYDQGTLQIMTLSAKHEKYCRLLEKMIGLLSIRLRIRILSFGSATMKKQRKEKGSEPDACFYVQSAHLIGKKEDIDFNADPPPDIVVEIDINHDSESKLSIYAALGVPEVWRYDGHQMRIYQLKDAEYFDSKSSLALPVLTAGVLTNFLTRSQQEDQYETLVAFEEWLRTLS